MILGCDIDHCSALNVFVRSCLFFISQSAHYLCASLRSVSTAGSRQAYRPVVAGTAARSNKPKHSLLFTCAATKSGSMRASVIAAQFLPLEELFDSTARRCRSTIIAARR